MAMSSYGKMKEEETFTSNQFQILSMEKTKEGASGKAYNVFK